MKWTNKGHEFDEIGKVFEKNRDLLFLGNIEKAKKMKECLSFLGANIYIPEIEYNPEKKDLFGFNLKKHINSSGTNLDKKTIVIFDDKKSQIENYLKNKNLNKNINFFNVDNFYGDNYFYNRYNDFIIKYLSIFSVYAYDKVYIHSNNIVSTTVCNLNCTLCLNYNPYNKHKEHIDISKLKYDIDMYFKHVDKVAFLHVTGGEPTLYPQQIEFIKYINNNHRNKIIDLVMPTNGIREISDDLCKTFKECNVLVEVDNYLKTVPQYRTIRDNNIEKLHKYNIRTNVVSDEYAPDFIQTYPPREDYSKLSDEENTKRFDYCGSIFSQIKDGGIHLCTYQSFAATAGLIEEDKESFFDLSSDNVNKKELVEFRLKYNNRGFSKFCTMCNGHPPLNTEFTTAAEQTSGTISWDGIFRN
uniref:radical SAM protein n=1 Tax=Brachyspira catarrhinii TaxID=2528966 RepID=UPI003F4BB53A